MVHIPCDICGRLVEETGSYVVRVDVFADPTPQPISTTDPSAPGVDDLLAELEKYSAEELQDQVHRRFEYRVCPGCQKLVLANPLGLPRRAGVSTN